MMSRTFGTQTSSLFMIDAQTQTYDFSTANKIQNNYTNAECQTEFEGNNIYFILFTRRTALIFFQPHCC